MNKIKDIAIINDTRVPKILKLMQVFEINAAYTFPKKLCEKNGRSGDFPPKFDATK